MSKDMNFRRVKNLNDLGLIEKWGNDLEIRPYFFPKSKNKDGYGRIEKSEIIKSIGRYSKTVYMVDFCGKTVGCVSYDTGVSGFSAGNERSASITIVAGEKNSWNQCMKRAALLEVEGMVSRIGIKKAELSVSSCNDEAFLLYQELGYEKEDSREGDISVELYEGIRMRKDL